MKFNIYLIMDIFYKNKYFIGFFYKLYLECFKKYVNFHLFIFILIKKKFFYKN